MKTSIFIFSATITFFTISLAYAGPGHDHNHSHDHNHGHSHSAPKKLDDKGLIAAASKGVNAIVLQKLEIDGELLDESWSNTADAAKSVRKKGAGYSIVKFDKKDSKKSLYVLLSDIGEIYDANFSGEFSDLKDSPEKK